VHELIVRRAQIQVGGAMRHAPLGNAARREQF